MANQVNPPRGMRDILPGEKHTREQLISVIRTQYLQRGFQEIETPALEDITRLTSGQGGDNEKLVFQVLKRGEDLESAKANDESLADLGLRFDLTVPLTRFFATNQAALPKVFKAIQIGPVWRAERPQKGRYRQFLQCDIDIIGDSSILAEAELLSASLAALDALGLADATIRVNHRKVLTDNIAGLGIGEANQLSAMITIDKLDKVGIDGVCKELATKFDDQVATRAAEWLSSLNEQAFPEELQDLVSSLGKHGARLVYDASLVRGMGYYTGTIFEIQHPAASSSIGGGGRYDSMVGKWAGVDSPAVGISLGFERIVELAKLQNSQEPTLALILASAEDAETGLKMQAEVIASGKNCRLEIQQKNFKAQLAALAQLGVTEFANLEPGAKTLGELKIRTLD
ncbi:MAG: histidine--tRNA ligase [Aquiluna sp.]|nr:histidine--tRNA ligase [Aquiluna sp.]